MIERAVLAGLAALVVGGLAYWLLALAEGESARVATLLALPQRAGAPGALPAAILGRLGRMVPSWLVARLVPRGAALEQPDRGAALLFALVFVAAAFALTPLLALFAPASPLLTWRMRRWSEDRAARARRRAVERDVPAAIDVLVLALEAGLPFERAITAYTENVPSELAREFTATARDLEVGYRRREALDLLVARTQSRNLRALVGAIRLSDEFGTPLAPSLRAVATQLRAERRQRLHQAALRAPVTMLLPTAGFILLPIFAIILGPIALRIATGQLF